MWDFARVNSSPAPSFKKCWCGAEGTIYAEKQNGLQHGLEASVAFGCRPQKRTAIPPVEGWWVEGLEFGLVIRV